MAVMVKSGHGPRYGRILGKKLPFKALKVESGKSGQLRCPMWPDQGNGRKRCASTSGYRKVLADLPKSGQRPSYYRKWPEVPPIELTWAKEAEKF